MQNQTQNFNEEKLSSYKPYTLINDYLFAFRNVLKRINGDNLVLAGVHALKLHGLKMSREANDLDIVIFKPTEEQLKFLRDISIISSPFEIKHYPAPDTINIQDENYPTNNMVLKFKKSNFNIDIILTDEQTPEQLLTYNFYYNNHKWTNKNNSDDCLIFNIQNIQLNIEAKNSYSIRNSDGLRLYRRVKDMIDFQDLKNSNFNI